MEAIASFVVSQQMFVDNCDQAVPLFPVPDELCLLVSQPTLGMCVQDILPVPSLQPSALASAQDDLSSVNRELTHCDLFESSTSGAHWFHSSWAYVHLQPHLPLHARNMCGP